MQIKKLSKELQALRDKKTEEYGPFSKKMQNIADIWTVLVGKKIVSIIEEIEVIN